MGYWSILENPADPGGSYPSFWCSKPVEWCHAYLSSKVLDTCQCACGCLVQRRTGLWTAESMELCDGVVRGCCGRRHATQLPVSDRHPGCFPSAQLARYPRQFAEAIAGSLLARLELPRAGPPKPWAPPWKESMWSRPLLRAVAAKERRSEVLAPRL